MQILEWSGTFKKNLCKILWNSIYKADRRSAINSSPSAGEHHRTAAAGWGSRSTVWRTGQPKGPRLHTRRKPLRGFQHKNIHMLLVTKDWTSVIIGGHSGKQWWCLSYWGKWEKEAEEARGWMQPGLHIKALYSDIPPADRGELPDDIFSLKSYPRHTKCWHRPLHCYSCYLHQHKPYWRKAGVERRSRE